MVRVESRPLYCGQGPSRTYAERGCYQVRMDAYQRTVSEGNSGASQTFSVYEVQSSLFLARLRPPIVSLLLQEPFPENSPSSWHRYSNYSAMANVLTARFGYYAPGTGSRTFNYASPT